MKTKKRKAETFYLYTKEDPRDREMIRLADYLSAWPDDLLGRVIVREGEEGRRNCANRLYQDCLGQIVEEYGKDESALAGWCKHRILLPMKFTYAAKKKDEEMMERAELERDVCSVLMERYSGERLYQTFDSMIRSKAPYTTVGLFAAYFDRMIAVWNGKGMTFDIKPQDWATVRAEQEET